MKVMGIDPGIGELGWVVLDAPEKFRKKTVKEILRNVSVVDFDVIRTQSDEEITERLAFIFRSIRRVVRKYKPEVAGIESVFVWKDPQSSLKLGMSFAVGGLTLALANTKTFVFTPTQIKSIFAGDPFAKKEKITKIALRFFPEFDGAPHHITDAFATAVCALLKNAENGRRKNAGRRT